MNVDDAIAQSTTELLRLDDQIATARARLDELVAQRERLDSDTQDLQSFLEFKASPQFGTWTQVASPPVKP